MQPMVEACEEDHDELPKLTLSKHNSSSLTSSVEDSDDDDDDDLEVVNHVVNKRKTLLQSCFIFIRIELYRYLK